MNASNKRLHRTNAEQNTKRKKMECSYGEACYRMNPAHFREYSHPHLEAILDACNGTNNYCIPQKYNLQKAMITEQLNVIMEKKLYEPVTQASLLANRSSITTSDQQVGTSGWHSDIGPASVDTSQSAHTSESSIAKRQNKSVDNVPSTAKYSDKTDRDSSKSDQSNRESLKNEKSSGDSTKSDKPSKDSSKNDSSLPCVPDPRVRVPDSEYRPVVPPTRRAEDYLRVVRPRGGMLAKLARSAPYRLLYTAIADCPATHSQPYSVTFQELLDPSLGELRSSLQINFMVEPGWLLAHYYFAGYSAKRLTILYGEECDDMRRLAGKAHVDAVQVHMGSPFGKHHTKLMLLCYEDGSLRVVVSTANLYSDDWENRTQGLWVSDGCPPLPPGAAPSAGDSRTGFKRSLLRYLQHYGLPQLQPHIRAVECADFQHVNAFLVCSVPGSHKDAAWGQARVGALLRQHCAVPAHHHSAWPLLAQASSLGSFGPQPQAWLAGDFLHNFTKSSTPPQGPSAPPPLQLIYPSLENVKSSHDGLLGGGCLPYAAAVHAKQPWLNAFLYQWVCAGTDRSRAMPHVKSYARLTADCKAAAFFLLTSANVSKAAWGSRNKGDGALRLMSYEAGVLLLPKHVIDAELFPLEAGAARRLVVPYDLPPTKYTPDMSPWVSDYLY